MLRISALIFSVACLIVALTFVGVVYSIKKALVGKNLFELFRLYIAFRSGVWAVNRRTGKVEMGPPND